MGLLSLGPMSGYDLNQLAAASIANFWPISKSQIYAELSRLEEMGLCRGTDVSQQRLPDKRNFQLTRRGEIVLDEWLDASGHPPDRFRSGFLVKVFFGNRMSKRALRELLGNYEASAEQTAERLAGVVDALKGAEHRYRRATAVLGLRIARTCADWAAETARELAGERRAAPAERRAAGASRTRRA